MSPKTGRPKAERPKAVHYNVRVDEATEEKLKDYCDQKKITRAEAIRKGIHLLLAQEK